MKQQLSKKKSIKRWMSFVVFKIVESLYKTTLTLKDTKSEQSSVKIVESLYKITLTLKDRELEQRLLEDYVTGMIRIFQSKYFVSNQKKIIDNIKDCSSSGQLKSKFWLIDILKQKNLLKLGNVFLCAGWYGFLPYFLLSDKNFSIQRMFNFEKDPLSVSVSEDLNHRFIKDGWKFKATLKDILNLNYDEAQFDTLKANGDAQALTVSPDTIINTSCEHMDLFSKWWNKLPQKKLIILQSNNFFELKEHINCISSLKAFKKQAPLELIYEGELDLKQYKRFMLIGYKK